MNFEFVIVYKQNNCAIDCALNSVLMRVIILGFQLFHFIGHNGMDFLISQNDPVIGDFRKGTIEVLPLFSYS